MTVTLNTIMGSTEVLQQLLNINFPARTAYKIARLLAEIEKEQEIVHKTRTQLIDKYGQKDESGKFILNEEKNIQLKPDCVEKFNQELMELLETNIELTSPYLTLEELEMANFTPQQMYMLMPYIQE